MNDLISRQDAMNAINAYGWLSRDGKARCCEVLTALPSVEPTLYGYKIEILAYIARVMQKEGITAEDAARTFSDIGYAVSMIRDEIWQKMEEAIYDLNTGKI